MDTATIQDQISGFLTKELMLEFSATVTAQTDLFEAGLIDSYGFIDLVGYIERTFSIALSDDDLVSPAMGTLTGITEIVEERLSGQ